MPQLDLRRIQDVSVNGFIPHPMCVTFLTLSTLNAETSKSFLWVTYIFIFSSLDESYIIEIQKSKFANIQLREFDKSEAGR